MAIEIVGGAYCPLSPRDPPYRLQALVRQTQSYLILIHWLTTANFNNDMIRMKIDSVLTNNNSNTDVHINLVSSVEILENNIA
jgi:hypothetical protein